MATLEQRKALQDKVDNLRNKMELFDLFQQDDEVGQALKDLEVEILNLDD